MDLTTLLDIPQGIVCLTGSGGKTTLAHRLAAQLPGPVIFCTTTRIYPSDTLPVLTDPTEQQLIKALDAHKAVCIGTPAPQEKLAAPSLPFSRLAQLAPHVLVEADGSKGLPMKAHLPHEPVIPPGCGRTILLVGASGFGRPIAPAAPRPARFFQLCGAAPDVPITAHLLAKVLLAEGGFDAVVVNQVVDAASLDAAKTLSALLPVPVFAGQVRQDTLERL